ncbi:UDP-N-acetylmuramoyl-L-alanyl-D-glutamate--2,6-diaminopimelate ligase MurE homolog, chloroplastic [Physcomitrium patens]|uniref:UDP-N-acetylmuramoyl-L-alanyl-D-glutamate--2,6-diaminopimelate ligase MurE homolog, chloroplastic n=1 Tax=Physcomitrium patens TaxID=3218 RepID=A0A2K1IHA8_PHYPA|nr:UDP-N-acetylmuramoyl-L-alanyl-D-glutamate--2,6-diaminopimelate ligase MurE homolog, chloroplastic-like [Physcomitrium patens]PNR28662.1 hypothetical protein PHYPA_029255 [Physcomitrium patens]|eukprot:XP_024364396.1 UDP-N-acetylmuramoyl-L-alanyl-D-glutamate--2,6-diaminopimelate ligase MurE homolog, chloroplastic-like [Physcomitrella patens]
MALQCAHKLVVPSQYPPVSPSESTGHSLRFSQSCLVKSSVQLRQNGTSFGRGVQRWRLSVAAEALGNVKGGFGRRSLGHRSSVEGVNSRDLVRCRTRRRNDDTKEFDDYINPAKAEPMEAMDAEDEDMSKFDRVVREAEKVRKSQEEEYKRTKPVFMRAIGLGDQVGEEEEEEEDEEEIDEEDDISDFDDTFELVDAAIASKKSQTKSNGRKPAASKPKPVIDEDEEELDPEEVADLEDIDDAIPLDEELDEDEDGFINFKDETFGGLRFDDDEVYNGDEGEAMMEPTYRMTLAELLDEARVTPVAVEGNLDIEITGIQHDSRLVIPGDLFVCVKGLKSDGYEFAHQAIEKGAVAIVSSSEVLPAEGLEASVVVEDTNILLSGLAGAFYGHPSKNLAVVGITGTNGKATTSYLIRSIYEAMGLQAGLLGTINYYINGKKKLEATHTTPDAVHLQKHMASMVHHGTDACIMEVSSHAMHLGRCKEVDFDVAVFTNLTHDPEDFHKSEDEYKEASGKLFAKMVNPEKHRKIVNIDDPQSDYFVTQGNQDVPVVTYAMGNKNADVYPLEVQLSLFESELLVRTPRGNLEISSGLLGRHNVYNILAAVAVGIAVDAPLEDIVRGIEEVDAVPGRCELIDEEQAFAVIVDHANTPDGLSRLLDTVRECGPRRIITVLGSQGDRDKAKRPLMAKIATDKSDVCIFTSDNPRSEDPLDVIDDMLAGVGWSMEEYCKWGEDDYYPPLPNGHRLFCYEIRTIAVRAGVAMGEEGDAVVIAGKGHNTYEIIGDNKEYFDDREECREALQHVDDLHAAGVDTSEFPWRVPESN